MKDSTDFFSKSVSYTVIRQKYSVSATQYLSTQRVFLHESGAFSFELLIVSVNLGHGSVEKILAVSY